MPVAPVAPVRPVGPGGPAGPFAPVGPVRPVDPTGPGGPFAPVAPVRPVGPVGPAGPTGPVAPAGPGAPTIAAHFANAPVASKHTTPALAAVEPGRVGRMTVPVVGSTMSIVKEPSAFFMATRPPGGALISRSTAYRLALATANATITVARTHCKKERCFMTISPCGSWGPPEGGQYSMES